MKSLKQLQDEYALHDVEIGNVPYDSEDIQIYIKGKILELNEEKLDILKAIKSNCLNKNLARIRNIFASLKENISYYDEDNLLLESELDLALKYKNYFLELFNKVNAENVGDCYKLFDFTSKNYDDNLLFLEEKRDALDYERKFISYQATDKDGSVNSFSEFFQEEMERISLIKPLEKKKEANL